MVAGGREMLDVAMILITLFFFGTAIAYTAACDKLK
jgi:hypothetical protein